MELLAPLVPSHGELVLSSDEIFAIYQSRLRHPVGKLGMADRAKIRPALDKVIGEY